MGMTYHKKFRSWASKAQIPEAFVETIIHYAPTNAEFERAAEEMRPQLYPLQGILAVQSRDEIDIDALADGFLVIGSCPNGDPILIDLRSKSGSIWYLSHEEMFHVPLRSVCIRVANDLKRFVTGCRKDMFPIDYWEAKRSM